MDVDKLWARLRKRRIDGKDLVIAIAQDYKNKDVLMTAYQDKEALEKTLGTGEMHYFSTSRQRAWRKGESSGNTQKLKSVRRDCDGDALLFMVDQKVAACHEGYKTCFYADLEGNILEKQLFDPKKAYGEDG
ncbi:MAG: phosphoribosyl-AMP cyclohydrolase [Candidatus Altiarchaeota archaeon]|nr:phosphoribosyl-AMP cyclohydrolase [Candidatus Altiarchaeota archaeon]